MADNTNNVAVSVARFDARLLGAIHKVLSVIPYQVKQIFNIQIPE
jgi:hypothetical protein